MSSVSLNGMVRENGYDMDAISPRLANRISAIYADDIDDDVDSYETIRFTEDEDTVNNLVQDGIPTEDLELLDQEAENIENLSSNFDYSNDFRVNASRAAYYSSVLSSFLHRADSSARTLGYVLDDYVTGTVAEDDLILANNISSRCTAFAYNFSFIVRIAIRNSINSLESLNHDDRGTASNALNSLSSRIDESVRIRLSTGINATVADVD